MGQQRNAVALAINLSGALAPTTLPQGGTGGSAGSTTPAPGTTGLGYWQGGRAVLNIVATAYDGTTSLLEGLGADQATWVAISAKITANGITAYDLPEGWYRIHMGASGSAVYATIASVPY